MACRRAYCRACRCKLRRKALKFSFNRRRLSIAVLLVSINPSARLKSWLDWQNQQCYSYPWWCISFGWIVVFQQQINQIRRQPSNHQNTRFSLSSGCDCQPRSCSPLGEPFRAVFRLLHSARPSAIRRQMASGRGGHHHPRRKTLAVAGDRRGWKRARYSRATTTECEGGKAFPAGIDLPVRHAEGRDHGQAAQLHQAGQDTGTERRPPRPQRFEHCDRSFTPPPTRKREKVSGRFTSARQAQRFLPAHDQINLIFRPRRHKLIARSCRHARSDAFDLRAQYAAEMTA